MPQLKVSRRGAISPFIVMDVMRAANEREAKGVNVVHLEVGQPSTAAPARVLEAARQALGQDRIGYTEALGIPPLRERIARHYREEYGALVPPERVVVTTGSSGAFLLSFLAAFDPGDRVAIASPGYPAYRNILSALGVEIVFLPSDAQHRFQPTPELLDAVPGKLDGLIVASPCNPAGTMLRAAELERLAGWCETRGVRLVSDEIYHRIVYGPKAATALVSSGSAIVINSFSKYYSMTGWRLGWMVAPPDLVRAVECLAQNLFISPPTLSQLAALPVFECTDELDRNVARYASNRELLLNELPKAGFDKLTAPDGAFYLYADVGGFTEDSVALCRRMLAEAAVAVTPGIDFDPAAGNRFVRFSFAGSTEDMAEAAQRLRQWRRNW
jgi:aspartate/methionine/tyrosine aminotransferase